MPTVCVYRPNRSKPRRWTENDVERVARAAHNDGVPWFKLLVAVALAGGFGWMICKLTKYLDFLVIFKEFIAEVTLLTSAGVALRVVISWLTKFGLRIPGVAWIVALIIAILVLVERIIERTIDVVEDLEDINRIKRPIEEACDWIGIRVKTIQDKGNEVFLIGADRELIPPQS